MSAHILLLSLANLNRRGTRADFNVLKEAGIELKGKIALANYGGIYRGTKVKNAQDNGMVGCVIYTDPLDDGEITEENGYEAYPSMFSQTRRPREAQLADIHRWTGAKPILHPTWQRSLLVALLWRPNNSRLGIGQRFCSRKCVAIQPFHSVHPSQHERCTPYSGGPPRPRCLSQGGVP